MKNLKHLSALLLVIVIVSLFVACGNEIVDNATDRIEDKIENKVDHVEDKVENSIENALSPEKPAVSSPEKEKPADSNADVSPVGVPAVPEAVISAQEAEAIALAHAQFAASEVVMDRTEYDFDDRIPHYEIEFHKDWWEYSYDIHAETGEILSYEVDD